MMTKKRLLALKLKKKLHFSFHFKVEFFVSFHFIFGENNCIFKNTDLRSLFFFEKVLKKAKLNLTQRCQRSLQLRSSNVIGCVDVAPANGHKNELCELMTRFVILKTFCFLLIGHVSKYIKFFVSFRGTPFRNH